MTHLTTTYSEIHSAIRTAGRELGIEPYVVRVVLAIYDRGGEATSDELEADLSEAGTAVRRALLTMYRREFAIGLAADGGPRRPGQRSRVTLTPTGALIARSVIARFSTSKAAA